MDYSKVLSQQFQIKEEYAKNIISLLDDGNTIPFIARYRKEMHGSMDDQLIREFSEKLEYLRSLDKRREEIRTLIDGQEKLTDEISLALDKAETLSELEDIYRPYRPKRKTRASVAKEKDLSRLPKLSLSRRANVTLLLWQRSMLMRKKALQMLKMHCKAQWILLRKRFRIMRKSESA